MKVKLPKSIVISLDELKAEGLSPINILQMCSKGKVNISLQTFYNNNYDKLLQALNNGYENEAPESLNTESVYIWKGKDTRERYKVKIKELDIILSVFKDTHKKTYEKIDRLVKGLADE